MLNVELKLKQDQITGFSYSFAKALLDRLCSLFKESGTCIESTNITKGPGELKVLVGNLIHYLKDQIPGINWAQIQVDLMVHNWDSPTEYHEAIKSSLYTGYDFLSTFEIKEPTENKQEIDTLGLQQKLKEFIAQKLNLKKISGGTSTKASGRLDYMARYNKDMTVENLLEIPNPTIQRNRVGNGNVWRNYGNKSHEWLKSEFQRLGFEVEKYPFFQ